MTEPTDRPLTALRGSSSSTQATANVARPSGAAHNRPQPLRRRVRAKFLAGLTRAAGTLPPRLLAELIDLGLVVSSPKRFERLVHANLERALGLETTPEKRRAIAAGVRRHAARQMAEWARLAKGGSDLGQWIDEMVEFDPSIEALEQQRDKGRGLLIVTAHLGNWELMAAALHRRGLRGRVVGRTRAGDSTHRWLVEMRESYGVSTLAQDAAPRRMLETLRQGQVLGLLCDLEVKRLHGLLLPFFGLPSLTMTAPAALARASGLPVHMLRCVLRDDRYRIFAEPAMDLQPGGKQAAVGTMCTSMNATFERWIREDPEQWCWHQPRWRFSSKLQLESKRS